MTLAAFLYPAPVLSDNSVGGSSFTASAVYPLTPFVDDFNDGMDPNFWAGNYFGFRGGGDVTVAYSAESPNGGSGKSLKITYNLPSPGTFVGCAMTLNNTGSRDIRAHSFIEFFVRGSAPNLNFKLELHNTSANADRRSSKLYASDYLDGGLTTDWQRVRIPLAAFANLDSLSNVNELVFVFERDYNDFSGFANAGSVFIDDITFGSGLTLPVRIDHFGDNWGLNALGGNMGGMNPIGTPHSFSFSANSLQYHNFSRGAVSDFNLLGGGWAGVFFIFGGGLDSATPMTADFSAYNQLSLWIKDDSPVETIFGVKIELQDGLTSGIVRIPQDTTTPLEPISKSWKHYFIDLSRFSPVNKSRIRQMNIVCDLGVTVFPLGKVYYDEIEFIP